MSRRALFVVCLLAGACQAQYSRLLQLPPGQVGRPYEFYEFGDAGAVIEGTSVTTTGTLPPGMRIAPFLRYTGTPTAAGTYRFEVIVPARQDGVAGDLRIFCTHVVIAAAGDFVSVEPLAQTISTTVDAGAQTRSIVLTNRSGQAKTFTARTNNSAGRNWLSITGSGTLAPYDSASVSIVADPLALGVGTYTGTITIDVAPSGERLTATVLLTVTASTQNLVLTQSGLSFQAAQGGAPPPPFPFSVFNESAGAMNWTALASTNDTGAWLRVTPNNGTSTGSQGRELQVRVNPSGLTAGDYYGHIEVRAAGAANSPQIVAVVLNVTPADRTPGPVVTPTALVFVARQGAANPPAQAVTLSTLTGASAPFQSTVTMESGGAVRFAAQPASGTVGGSQPARVNVTANAAGLAAGVYPGELQLALPGGVFRRVALLLVVQPPLPAATNSKGGARAAQGCTPTRLLPVFTALGNGFRVAAGWPVPVETRIVDDCGDPMTRGSVVATFANGDAPVPLVALQDGRWSWTWTPRNIPASSATGQVTVTVEAQTTEPPLTGSGSAGGLIDANSGIPVVAPGGVLNAASFERYVPMGPGSLVSVFGAALSERESQSGVPRPTSLAGTRVLFGGRALPLIFTSGGQVNALLPMDMPPNTTAQLMVRNGNRNSAPEPVTIAAAQPGVFEAGGRAIAIAVRPDGSSFLVTPEEPAGAGDALVMFCTGLGPTDPPSPPGEPALTDTLQAVTGAVTVRIGDRDAPVAFAGLTPGFTGLYQVNVTAPEGVPAGDAPVIITASGQSSKPAVIALR